LGDHWVRAHFFRDARTIKTYTALALFLSKAGIKERVQMADQETVISPTYHKERMREARKIVHELKKPS
jgi:hypothetical protein